MEHHMTEQSSMTDREGINTQAKADEGNGDAKQRRLSKREQDAEAGYTVDVVLSDMSAPWDQTSGFFKRSISDPYYRMLNTSGMAFRDHAGSMVSIIGFPFPFSHFFSDRLIQSSVSSIGRGRSALLMIVNLTRSV